MCSSCWDLLRLVVVVAVVAASIVASLALVAFIRRIKFSLRFLIVPYSDNWAYYTYAPYFSGRRLFVAPPLPSPLGCDYLFAVFSTWHDIDFYLNDFHCECLYFGRVAVLPDCRAVWLSCWLRARQAMVSLNGNRLPAAVVLFLLPSFCLLPPVSSLCRLASGSGFGSFSYFAEASGSHCITCCRCCYCCSLFSACNL